MYFVLIVTRLSSDFLFHFHAQAFFIMICTSLIMVTYSPIICFLVPSLYFLFKAQMLVGINGVMKEKTETAAFSYRHKSALRLRLGLRSVPSYFEIAVAPAFQG